MWSTSGARKFNYSIKDKFFQKLHLSFVLLLQKNSSWAISGYTHWISFSALFFPLIDYQFILWCTIAYIPKCSNFVFFLWAKNCYVVIITPNQFVLDTLKVNNNICHELCGLLFEKVDRIKKCVVSMVKIIVSYLF